MLSICILLETKRNQDRRTPIHAIKLSLPDKEAQQEEEGKNNFPCNKVFILQFSKGENTPDIQSLFIFKT